jgi:hypothetical protein
MRSKAIKNRNAYRTEKVFAILQYGWVLFPAVHILIVLGMLLSQQSFPMVSLWQNSAQFYARHSPEFKNTERKHTVEPFSHIDIRYVDGGKARVLPTENVRSQDSGLVVEHR